MKNKKIVSYLALIMIAVLVLAGCAPKENLGVSSVSATSEVETQSDAVLNSEEITSTDAEESSSKEEVSSKNETSSKTEVSSKDETNSRPNPRPQNTESTSSKAEAQNGLYPPPSFRESSVNFYLEELIRPAIYSDNMRGSSVNFKTKTTAYALTETNQDWNAHRAVIRSYEQLQQICQNEKDIQSKKHYLESYTEEFFKKNFLIVLFISRDNPEFSYSIDKVTQTSEAFYVKMKNAELPKDKKYRKISTAFRTVIEIERGDIMRLGDMVYICDTVSESPSKSEPKPISPNALILKPDVNEPVAITFTDKMQGKEIQFEEQTFDISSKRNGELDYHIAVIRSHDELKKLWQSENSPYTSTDYTRLYTEEDFEDNVLIMLFVYCASPAYGYTVNHITEKDGTLYIRFFSAQPEGYVTQLAVYYRTFIKVSKNDMADVTNILVHRTSKISNK